MQPYGFKQRSEKKDSKLKNVACLVIILMLNIDGLTLINQGEIKVYKKMLSKGMYLEWISVYLDVFQLYLSMPCLQV